MLLQVIGLFAAFAVLGRCAQPPQEAINESPYLNATVTQTLETNKRIILIGDVHGSAVPLMNLLDKVSFTQERDQVVFVGDLIAKGPESMRVLQIAHDIKASCVRGNHDDRVIRWKGYINRLSEEGNKNFDLYVGDEELPEEFVRRSEHHSLARRLPDHLHQYLLSCPLTLGIPQHNIYVVHAGILPPNRGRDMSLSSLSESLDPWSLMNMRNVNKKGKPIRKTNKGKAWSEVWNDFAKDLPGAPTIVYAHAAGRGLDVKDYSIGIDSGCVYGGQLTALIYDNIGEYTLQSIECSHS